MAQIKLPKIEPKIHRRILRFLNAAHRPEDLFMAPPLNMTTFPNNRMFTTEGDFGNTAAFTAAIRSIRLAPCGESSM